MATPPQPDSFVFDMKKVKRNVAELSMIVGEGVAKVTKTKDGSHQLRVQDPLRFTVYSDGIFVLNGPFRRFSEDPTAKTFVKDLADGFFPSEIQARFPEGVPLELEDRSTEAFDAAGPPPRSTSHSPPAGTAMGPASTDRAKFERALPQVVIRGGLIVPVRGAIKAIISGTASSPAPKEQQIVEDASAGSSEVLSLKVLVRCKGKSIEVRISKDSALGSLKKVIEKHHGSPCFKLSVSPVPPAPPRTLEQSDDASLLSALDIDRTLIRVLCECGKK